jgi:hypothetical protein
MAIAAASDLDRIPDLTAPLKSPPAAFGIMLFQAVWAQ